MSLGFFASGLPKVTAGFLFLFAQGVSANDKQTVNPAPIGILTSVALSYAIIYCFCCRTNRRQNQQHQVNVPPPAVTQSVISTVSPLPPPLPEADPADEVRAVRILH